MDWALVIILLVIFQPSLAVVYNNVFFTVEAEQTAYKSEFEGDVVMGCRFQPKLSNPDSDLKVTWHLIKPGSDREVYRMDNGVEHSASQEYQGRVKLLTEQLKEGWAKLKLSSLKIGDSGTYQCLVQTGEGADYKTLTLSVVAPYKVVTKHIEKSPERDEVLLTCQSEGYPKSSVAWQDGRLQNLNPNTTVASTPDQLFNITSQIRVSSSDKNNYTCNFTNDGVSATFHVPDEIPIQHVRNDAVIIILSIGVVMLAIIFAKLIYHQQKGSRTPGTRNRLVSSQDVPLSASVCLQINEENGEERTILKEEVMEENLRVFLKAHYSNASFSKVLRCHLGTFDVEELPHMLQNNDSQAVKLKALLPEAGETLFLEGPPGSGRTAIAHILDSWTEGPTHYLTSLLDLSILHLLLYVDCSAVTGDLFQEILTQFSLTEETLTEHHLRTVLTRSSEALLLLDGYREGNQLFDESLQRFLSERGRCRVLVVTCPGHCPVLKEKVGAGGVLKLQTQ